MILHIYDTEDTWMLTALEHVVDSLSGDGVLHLCLAGGSTPKPLYEKLSQDEKLRAAAASDRLHLWIGDERQAPLGTEMRNSEMIAECFASDNFNVHSWPAGSRETSSLAYEKEFIRYAREKLTLGKPVFDLVLLGMGEDGHTAGLFSESDLHRSDDRLVLLTDAPRHPRYRMTFSPQVLKSAKKIIVLIQGLKKTRVLMANLFGEREDPIRIFLGDSCEVISFI